MKKIFFTFESHFGKVAGFEALGEPREIRLRDNLERNQSMQCRVFLWNQPQNIQKVH